MARTSLGALKLVAMLGDLLAKEKPVLRAVLLVIFCIPGTLTDTGLEGKVFLFPKTSIDSYVLLKPEIPQELQHFTLSLRFFTDLTRSFVLFSAASRQHDNEVLLIRHPQEYHACVGGECTTFSAPSLANRSAVCWEAACVTWDSATGIIQLWLDRQCLPRKGVARGYRVKTDLVMILGQEQDSYGGSFEAGQSFVGEMAEVYLWDRILPVEQISRIQRPTTPAPLVDWSSLKFEIHGYVLVEPTVP